MSNIDISWLSLGVAFLLLLIPYLIFRHYKTGLNREMLIAFGRMALQLILVGIYLKYIFMLDYWWLNLLWVIIMIIASSVTIARRSDLNLKNFIMPLIIANVLNLVINGAAIAFMLSGIDNYFRAQYLIPITGMLIGNSLGSSIVGLRALFNSVLKEEERFKYLQICGASISEAMQPYISESLKSALNPAIANTATIGLIWLPGMMTGQILAGSEPTNAIKYQIMIVLTIFIASVISLFVAIWLGRKFAINQFGLLNHDIFRKK